MKQISKTLRLLLAVSIAACCTAVTAFAAQQPCIVLKASGARNQYTLRLDTFSSDFESVQFDIVIDGQVEVPRVEWRDDSPAHYQEITTATRGGDTVLTVSIDRLRPIANSNSVELADITFSKSLSASAFSAGEEMVALDKNQDKTVYHDPAISVRSRTYESSDDSSDTLRWGDVSGSTTQIGGRKALTVRVRSGEVVSQDIFRQAAEDGLLLVLDYGDYRWTFDTAKGVSIPDSQLYYDFAVDQINYRNLSAAVSETDLVQLETAHSGALPCEGVLSWPVGTEQAGATAYLSFYNENLTRLDYRATLQVTGDGMAELPLSRGGKYVVSSRNFWSQPDTIPTGSTQPPQEVPEVTVPPEDQVTAPAEPPEPEEPESASSLPPEALEPDGEGGKMPGWVLPLVGALVLLVGGGALAYQLWTGKNNDIQI